MGQATRDLTPCRIALGLEQGSDIVKDHDVATRLIALPRQHRTGTHQHAPTHFATEHDLFPPLTLATLQMALTDGEKLLQQRLVPGHGNQRFTHLVLQVHAQDGAGRLIGGADAQV